MTSTSKKTPAPLATPAPAVTTPNTYFIVVDGDFRSGHYYSVFDNRDDADEQAEEPGYRVIAITSARVL